MSKERLVSIDDLKQARDTAVTMLAEHCRSGVQTTDLGNEDIAACGQFVGAGLTQRGLHGTAAALAVLANANVAADEVTRRHARDLWQPLVRYIATRQSVESRSQTPVNAESLVTDTNNVIKQCEILFALNQLPREVPGVMPLRTSIVESLKKGMRQCAGVAGRAGWSYFLDDSMKPDLLPTAHAVLALQGELGDLTGPIAFLLDSIETGNPATTGEDADISVRIFALYVLSFYCIPEHKGGLVKVKVVRDALSRLWKRTANLLRFESIEQNIEYWRNSETLYVRVPWQLYLIALATQESLFFWYGSRALQSRLRQVVDALKTRSFRYPHSGKMISSRTTAIAFEVCGNVLHTLVQQQRWLTFAAMMLTLDRIRTSERAKWFWWWFLIFVRLLAVAFGVLCIYKWMYRGADISQLAVEILGFIVVSILALPKGESN